MLVRLNLAIFAQQNLTPDIWNTTSGLDFVALTPYLSQPQITKTSAFLLVLSEGNQFLFLLCTHRQWMLLRESSSVF